MNKDPTRVFGYVKKQRVQLLVNLIADRIKEDTARGRPLLKRIEVEEAQKQKHKLSKSLPEH